MRNQSNPSWSHDYKEQRIPGKVFPWPLGSVHTRFYTDLAVIRKNTNRPVIAPPWGWVENFQVEFLPQPSGNISQKSHNVFMMCKTYSHTLIMCNVLLPSRRLQSSLKGRSTRSLWTTGVLEHWCSSASQDSAHSYQHGNRFPGMATLPAKC